MRDPLGWLFFLVAVGGLLILGLVMSRAFAQEEIVAVPRKQIEQLVAEHFETLRALEAAEKEIARLKVKLACV